MTKIIHFPGIPKKPIAITHDILMDTIDLLKKGIKFKK